MTSEGNGDAGCLCGAVRLRTPGEAVWTAWCHCPECRRATGAPASVWVGYRASRVEWLGEPPARHRSSPHITRTFCARCGSTLTYRDDRLGDELYVAVGVLDRPETVEPRAHAFERHRLEWVHLDDGLPRLDEYSRPRPGTDSSPGGQSR